ncbi:hypothetical protein HPB49_023035 [Dermacentor silvarum]|uniref:Uncharacterized protein n=1 Tax=Dermacentor silvarum TaxID=543639 RepID=A0ACB8CI28_DERSI|nr:hypothetical protein HPB49_023035 [Dermacentor silvarum]
MDGTTVLLIEGAKERRNQRSEEGPSAEVRQPSQIQEESDLDARLRTAITVGVMTMVILGLLAMVYAFNEAQRQLEYLQDSDNVKPIECASNSTYTSAATTDDLDIVSFSTEADGEKKGLPSTAKATSDGDGSKKTDDEGAQLKQGGNSD